MRITKLIAKERPVHFDLNHETRTLSGSNGKVHTPKLGGKEFTILKRLFETPDEPVATADLFNTAWKYSPNAELSYVARTISDLRQKLEDTEPTKRFIETADSGYVLVAGCEHREEEPPRRVKLKKTAYLTARAQRREDQRIWNSLF